MSLVFILNNLHLHLQVTIFVVLRSIDIIIIIIIGYHRHLLKRQSEIGATWDVETALFFPSDGEAQQAHASSLLEAKRRGISRSALRSHQPVARPVTASLSR